jgi:hypothetical protein
MSSAIRLNQPTRKASVGLTAIAGGKLSQLVGRNAMKSRAGLVVLVVFGLGAIQVLQLLLASSIAVGAYDLSDLKKEKKELVVTQQILGEQVDSLASNQNLANAAQKMGMISNANPVFLRLSDKKVFGKPKAALNADNRLSRNLIKSSVLTVTSNLTTATEDTSAAQGAGLVPNATGLTVAPANSVVAATAVAAAPSPSLSLVPTVKSPTTKTPVATGGVSLLPVQSNH